MTLSIFSTGPLSFDVNVVDFEPGDHTLALTVTDARGQTDTEIITFTTPPRLVVTCSVADRILTCDSKSEITAQFCSFDGQSALDCSSSFNISELELGPGPHSVTVSSSDVFGQSTANLVDFRIEGGVSIMCQELVNGVDCQATGETGTVTFTCIYDDGPAEDCKCPTYDHTKHVHNIYIEYILYWTEKGIRN